MVAYPRESAPPAGSPAPTHAGWDTVVGSLPGGTVFHQSAWARVLTETYGFRAHAFTVLADNRIVGALPVMEVTSWLTGRRGIALPFSDMCAPLAVSTAVCETLLDQALSAALQRGWRFLEVRGGSNIFADKTPSNTFAHHTVPLENDMAKISARFSISNRRAIRKASGSGLRMRLTTNREDLRAFYHLHCLTRRRHGLPPQPFDFFRAIDRHFFALDRGRIALATLDDAPVAGALFLEAGNAACYKFAASDARHQSLRPNNLVLWHAIEDYCRRGFRALDLGRTSLHQTGLRRFKDGWGATEEILGYHRIDPATRRHLLENSRESGWHNSIFRRLPIPLSRWIGHMVYRHIA